METLDDASLPSVSCHNKGIYVFLLNSTAISATVPHSVLFHKSLWSDCYRLIPNIRGLMLMVLAPDTRRM